MKTRKNTCKNVFHMFYGQIAKTLSQDLWALSFKILKYFELKILKFRILTRCTPQCLTLTDTRCVDPSYNYSPPQSHYLLPGVIIEEIWGPAHPPAGHVTESGREGGAEYLQYYIIPVLQYYIIPVYYCILN